MLTSPTISTGRCSIEHDEKSSLSLLSLTLTLSVSPFLLLLLLLLDSRRLSSLASVFHDAYLLYSRPTSVRRATAPLLDTATPPRRRRRRRSRRAYTEGDPRVRGIEPCDFSLATAGTYGDVRDGKTTATGIEMVRRLRPWMVALLVEGRGMWRIEGLGRWVTSVSELPGALTRTNSHAARRAPGSLIQRAFSRCYPSLERGVAFS